MHRRRALASHERRQPQSTRRCHLGSKYKIGDRVADDPQYGWESRDEERQLQREYDVGRPQREWEAHMSAEVRSQQERESRLFLEFGIGGVPDGHETHLRGGALRVYVRGRQTVRRWTLERGPRDPPHLPDMRALRRGHLTATSPVALHSPPAADTGRSASPRESRSSSSRRPQLSAMTTTPRCSRCTRRRLPAGPPSAASAHSLRVPTDQGEAVNRSPPYQGPLHMGRPLFHFCRNRHPLWVFTSDRDWPPGR